MTDVAKGTPPIVQADIALDGSYSSTIQLDSHSWTTALQRHGRRCPSATMVMYGDGRDIS